MRAAESGGIDWSDNDAHNRAMELPIDQVVRELTTMLSATTVAVIGGVKETRAVQQWMDGRAPQRPHVLRFALRIAMMISGTGDARSAQAWFHGSNPHLGDASPMLVLRDGILAEVQGPLLKAARAFSGRNRTAEA